jgi:hypothetical protein
MVTKSGAKIAVKTSQIPDQYRVPFPLCRVQLTKIFHSKR